MSQALTVHDIARLAGVSAMTVSRVLNHPERVSPAMRAKVQAVVQHTGFVPNGMAGGLRSARARLVAAVLPTLVGPVFQETVQSLSAALAAKGYQLMIGQSDYNLAREDQLLDAVIRRRPDGIVLTGIMHSAAGRRQLLASGIPVVETWDLTPAPIDMLVGFSHADIGREVAKFLIGKGRRRLAMIRADDERADRRAKAFAAEVARSGLAEAKVEVVDVGASRTIKSGRDALTRLLALDPDVDAVFCSSDLLASGVVTQARVLGIDIPGRLAIVGFGDVPFVADMVPALSTVHINGADIGRMAARCLIDRAEGREVAQRVVDVGFSIVERETT